MRTLVPLLAMLVLGMVLARPVHAAEDGLFAVSPVYGLRPDGSVLERTDGKFGALREKNEHWDAATRTVKLYAAKNEEASFQVIIPRSGKGFAGRMEGLSGPVSIPAERISFSTRLWVNLKGVGLCPDLMVPLDGSANGLKSFDVPSTIKGLPQANNKAGALFVEIWVPKDAPAGAYKGQLAVLEGEAVVETLNVSLTVYDFALPDQATFAFDLLAYGMPAESLGKRHYICGDGVGAPAKPMPKELIALNHAAYKLAADHRAFVNLLPYSSQRGSPRFAYPVKGQGANATIMSYTEFDDLFGPILDGKASKFGVPPAHFTLAFNVNYPHVCNSDERKQFDWRPFKNSIPEGPTLNPKLKEFEDTNKAIAALYAKHFAEKGWKDTRFEIYHNQKANPDRNRLPWKLDEPTHGTDYKGLHYLLNTGKWAFAPAKDQGVQVVTRLDIGHFHCHEMKSPDGKKAVCYKAKEYDTHDGEKWLKGVVDHWVAGVTHVQAANHKVKDYEAPGVKMMTYGQNKYGIGKHFGEFAAHGYQAAQLGLVGHIIYKLSPTDPNLVADANVFYIGTPMGYEGFLAPARLKLWRDAINSYDYVLAARAKDAETVATLLKELVKPGKSGNEKYRTRSGSKAYWSTNNVEDLSRARRQLAALATGKKPAADAKLEGFSKEYSGSGTADMITGYD